MSELLQYLFSGVTVGATYALVGLGFAIIFNASRVINFAQGEFLMIGGMATVSMVAAAYLLRNPWRISNFWLGCYEIDLL